jgi:hypothetical protein
MAPFEPVLSDDELTSLLLSDARQASKNYASQGLSAYLPASKRPTPKIKPNTRFLQNLVRNADGHNERLRRREETERKEKLRVLEREAKKREGRLVTFSDDEEQQGGMNWGREEHGEEERRRKRRKTDENDEEGERRRHKSTKHSRGRDSERRRRKRRRNTSSAEESVRSRSRSPLRESRHHRKHRSKRDRSQSDSDEDHKHKSRSHRKEKRKRDDDSASEDDDESHSKPDKRQESRSKHSESSANPSKTIATRIDLTKDGTVTTEPQHTTPRKDHEDDWSLSLSALRERANHARIQAAKKITAKAHSEGSDSNIKWAKQGEEREWDRGKEVEDEGLHTRFEDD